MVENRSAKDFFISYAGADAAWAEWVGYVLEEVGFAVVLQAWDFRPGSNFVIEMQKAAAAAARTIMVLSPAYLKSQFAAPEWAAAFADDPQGIDRKLVPVVVQPCKPDGMLKGLVHIDLTGQPESVARQTLIDGLNAERAKPGTRPTFPGPAEDHPHKAFPGGGPATPAAPYMPKMRGAISDVDRRRFARQAFDGIASYFQSALPALASHGENIETDFQQEGASDFRAEIFVGGKSVAACRIWRGDAFSTDGICFVEGRNHLSGNSCNEILSTTEDDGELVLGSMMGGVGLGEMTKGMDLKRLTVDQAAEYLWRRFVSRLER